MRLILSLMLLLTVGCTSNQTLTLSYSGLKFNLPPDPVVIGLGSSNENVLIIKYSKALGERYIAFTQETEIRTGNCNYKQFFKYVLNNENKEYICGDETVAFFKDIFLDGTVGENDLYPYYSFRTKDNNAFVFLVIDESSIIKIESDFIRKEALSKVLPKYIHQ